ncbi:hypothetical protein EI94DRAFT_1703837 [Lactarius quietus]|nr:hypothetical protein EI94DRAFT_1703837 [Lactarius quietus]
MYPNPQDNSTHNRARGTRQNRTAPDAQSGQGEWLQPTYMEVDGDFAHYPGSGMVNPPASYSQRNQGLGVAISPMSPMGIVTEPYPQIPQQLLSPSRSSVASTSGHRISPQYTGSVSGSASLGPYSSNPLAPRIPPTTPAPSTAELRQGVTYGAAGGAAPSNYFPVDTRTSSSRSTGGSLTWVRPKVTPFAAAHGSGSGSSSSTRNTHQSRPRCKLPHCENPAYFDRRINEQREFCEEHIGGVVNVGFAGCCQMCKKMPARLDSDVCSEACRKMMASSSNSGYQQPTATGQPALQQIVQPTLQPSLYYPSQQPAAQQPSSAGDPRKRSRKDSIPDGLGPTCQECRRHFTKETRSRFCSKNCEDAHRKYNSSSGGGGSSSKSRRS